MNRFQIYRSQTAGHDTGALRPPSIIYHRVLEPDVQSDIIIPDGADIAVFNSDIDFWVGYDVSGSVTVPSADTDEGDVEYIPDTRFVGEATTLNLISDRSGFVSVVFYRGH